MQKDRQRKCDAIQVGICCALRNQEFTSDIESGEMATLEWSDYLAIVLYFVIVLGVGFWVRLTFCSRTIRLITR